MCTMSADPAGLNCLIVFEKQSCKGSVAKVVKILEKITRRTTGAKGVNFFARKIRQERSEGNHFLVLIYYYLFTI